MVWLMIGSHPQADHKSPQCSCKLFLFIFLWSAWWWLPSLTETFDWFYLKNKVVFRFSVFAFLVVNTMGMNHLKIVTLSLHGVSCSNSLEKTGT